MDCVVSQILSDKIKDIEITERRAEAIFMLHRVAKISMYFQGSPISVAAPRNMNTTWKRDFAPYEKLRALTPI
jgi:hypothetical protein